jgi:hypothetical protein
MIQEAGATAKTIETKIDELAALPHVIFDPEELAEIARIGDNAGCMELKGGNPSHSGDPAPDRWPLTNDLALVAERWQIDPTRDLVCTHSKAA